jgi:DNA end-binding protein Ku
MPRSIWKGSLSFGLVTIGVELFNAEAPERLDLDMLDKRDMSRIGYLKINKSSGKPVDTPNIVKGFEVAANRYVVLSPDDLKNANPKATQTLDVLGFVGQDAIPRIYYAKPYVVGPVKGSEKAYLLFRDILEETERVAVAQVVLRTRQYLAAVYPFDGALIAQMLRYDEEVIKPADAGVSIPRGLAKAVRPQELAMAKKLVQGMEMAWEPSEYHDEYRDDLLKLIKQRTKGAKAAKDAPVAPRETKVLDLMEALRRSVSDKSGATPRKGRVVRHAKHSRRSA